MNRILAWQEPKGCYSDDRQPFLKLTGFIGPASAPTPKEREVDGYLYYRMGLMVNVLRIIVFIIGLYSNGYLLKDLQLIVFFSYSLVTLNST